MSLLPPPTPVDTSPEHAEAVKQAQLQSLADAVRDGRVEAAVAEIEAAVLVGELTRDQADTRLAELNPAPADEATDK